MLVHILEIKLSKGTLKKWEATRERDKFDDMYEFLFKIAMCASKWERSRTTEKRTSENDRDEPPAKKKHYATNRIFIKCIAYLFSIQDKRYPLYLCDKFKRLSIPNRIELVKSAKHSLFATIVCVLTEIALARFVKSVTTHFCISRITRLRINLMQRSLILRKPTDPADR